MSWALTQIAEMSGEEISRKPRLCIDDQDFDEVEQILGVGPQPKDKNGDRRLTHQGVIIYTHYVNRSRGIN